MQYETALREMEVKQENAIKVIEERHKVEMKKAQEKFNAAEKIRRDKWIDTKTKKIKVNILIQYLFKYFCSHTINYDILFLAIVYIQPIIRIYFISTHYQYSKNNILSIKKITKNFRVYVYDGYL